jgi:hypothetical protein
MKSFDIIGKENTPEHLLTLQRSLIKLSAGGAPKQILEGLQKEQQKVTKDIRNTYE